MRAPTLDGYSFLESLKIQVSLAFSLRAAPDLGTGAEEQRVDEGQERSHPPLPRHEGVDRECELAGQERADLCARIQSPGSRGMLQRATAQYNCQDVQYRGQTVPVISQLLITISSLQNP